MLGSRNSNVDATKFREATNTLRSSFKLRISTCENNISHKDLFCDYKYCPKPYIGTLNYEKKSCFNASCIVPDVNEYRTKYVWQTGFNHYFKLKGKHKCSKFTAAALDGSLNNVPTFNVQVLSDRLAEKRGTSSRVSKSVQSSSNFGMQMSVNNQSIIGGGSSRYSFGTDKMLQQRILAALVKFICVSRIPYSIVIDNWSLHELIEIIAGEDRKDRVLNIWPGVKAVKTAIKNEAENLLNTFKVDIERKEFALVMQVDGWKSKSKEDINGFVTSHKGHSYFSGSFISGKKHFNILQDVIREIIRQREKLQFVPDALVTDDATANVFARAEIETFLPGITTLRCEAHQLNCISKRLLTKCSQLKSFFTDFNKVVASMRNSSKWRKYFVEAHGELYSGKVLFPEAYCETRWLTAFSAVSRMLQIRTAVQKATNLFRTAEGVGKNKRNVLLQTEELVNKSFFKSCKLARSKLKPIIKWLLILERDNVHLAQNFYCYIDLFREFSNKAGVARYTKEESLLLKTDLAYRFKQLEQPLFLLSFFLSFSFLKQRKQFFLDCLTDRFSYLKACLTCFFQLYYVKIWVTRRGFR